MPDIRSGTKVFYNFFSSDENSVGISTGDGQLGSGQGLYFENTARPRDPLKGSKRESKRGWYCRAAYTAERPIFHDSFME